VLDIAAAITVRYSDAPSGVPVQLSYELDDIRDLVSIAMPNNEVEVFRV
jgi:hypothetical protein